MQFVRIIMHALNMLQNFTGFEANATATAHGKTAMHEYGGRLNKIH